MCRRRIKIKWNWWWTNATIELLKNLGTKRVKELVKSQQNPKENAKEGFIHTF